LATEKQVNISAVCRQLGYSKQAYYKSVTFRRAAQTDNNIALLQLLQLRRYLPRLGVRKSYYLLKKTFMNYGLSIGRDKLFALVRREGLLVARKKSFTITTHSQHWLYKHRDLIRELPIVRPEQVWVADITYVATGAGFNYLHLVTDAYSKKIMGYYLSEDLRAENTINALKMALQNRQYQSALIHHSDRGIQYCSSNYVQLLSDNNIRISMTKDGSPYDNAVAERVNGILKDEFGLDGRFDNHKAAVAHIEEAVKLYNRCRPHLSCHMLTPEEMHGQDQLPLKSWRKKSRRTFESSSAFLPSPHLLNRST
jgi:putative transposase